MTDQRQIDAAYLREYVAFGSQSSGTIAQYLYAALVAAHKQGEYEKVAHLQLRLYAEMVMLLESFGAMLLAYSCWDKPGGILGTLLAYKPGDVLEYLDFLHDAEDILRELCFPEKDIIAKHVSNSVQVEASYNADEARKMIMDTCEMYRKQIIRTAYNKIKHAGLWIRNPEMLAFVPGKIVYGEDVYLISCSEKEHEYQFPAFKVAGAAGIRHADKHLNNINVISKRSRVLAECVAYFLEQNLLRPSRVMKQVPVKRRKSGSVAKNATVAQKRKGK